MAKQITKRQSSYLWTAAVPRNEIHYKTRLRNSEQRRPTLQGTRTLSRAPSFLRGNLARKFSENV